MTLIHYGSNKFDPEKAKPVKNHRQPFTKPENGSGFWTSPVNSVYGWVRFCRDAEFETGSLDQYFLVQLSHAARVMTIKTESDLDRLVWIESGPFAGIDFEAVAKDFDAIHLTWTGQLATRMTYPRNLYGWDCETVLILNPGIIIAAE